MPRVEHVRVKDNELGRELSVPVELYDNNPSVFTLVDKPAAETDGTPYPPKYKTTVAASATAKTTASNEAAKKAGQKKAVSSKGAH